MHVAGSDSFDAASEVNTLSLILSGTVGETVSQPCSRASATR